MLIPSEVFLKDVRHYWPKPKMVAEAALTETFRHPDHIDNDHDQQVNNALEVGLLVGTHRNDANPDAFIQAFGEFLKKFGDDEE